MTKARDIMTKNPQCVRASEAVLDAARRMADLSVGALPICGEDNRLHRRRGDGRAARTSLGGQESACRS